MAYGMLCELCDRDGKDYQLAAVAPAVLCLRHVRAWNRYALAMPECVAWQRADVRMRAVIQAGDVEQATVLFDELHDSALAYSRLASDWLAGMVPEAAGGSA